jgi:hypothetical protein
MEETRKPARGGSRPGAGRPRGASSKVVRLPVSLAPQDYARRLDPANHDIASLKRLWAAAPEEGLIEWLMSGALNNPRHEGPGRAEHATCCPKQP